MKPYYEVGGVTIYHGDSREVLPELGPFDTCLSDPPYGLTANKRCSADASISSPHPIRSAGPGGFMGEKWDSAVPGPEFWRLVLTALKPGALCLAFGGTRTYHRLACAIEDAGFEIRDCLMWLYGSGFPKSLDISKAIDKAAGAEREIIGPDEFRRHRANKHTDSPILPSYRKPRAAQVEANITAPSTDAAKQWSGWGTALKPAWEPVLVAMKPLDGTFSENAKKWGVAGVNVGGCRIGDGQRPPGALGGYQGSKDGEYEKGVGRQYDMSGRFPANLLLDSAAAAELDLQSGELASGALLTHHKKKGSSKIGTFSIRNRTGEECSFGGDAGGASRFFYTAKASGSERNDGYDVQNTHPTVKPLELMRYLCLLTSTPTKGSIVDPFMGSGSTLLAARDCGRRAVGIEIEEKYCEIAAKRLAQKVLF